MKSVRIQVHARPTGDDFEASDAATVQALRLSFPSKSNLVHAHEAREALTKIRPMWAKTLEGMEEAHMVEVRFED